MNATTSSNFLLLVHMLKHLIPHIKLFHIIPTDNNKRDDINYLTLRSCDQMFVISPLIGQKLNLSIL